MVRFLVTQIDPFLKIYMTPINIDPDNPALPIATPFYYSKYLSKLHGAFATLGLAEDTWALNEGVIDEAAFIRQPPMRRVILATMPCVAGAVYFYGWRCLALVAVACLFAYATEYLFCRIRGEPVTEAVFVTAKKMA